MLITRFVLAAAWNTFRTTCRNHTVSFQKFPVNAVQLSDPFQYNQRLRKMQSKQFSLPENIADIYSFVWAIVVINATFLLPFHSTLISMDMEIQGEFSAFPWFSVLSLYIFPNLVLCGIWIICQPAIFCFVRMYFELMSHGVNQFYSQQQYRNNHDSSIFQCLNWVLFPLAIGFTEIIDQFKFLSHRKLYLLVVHLSWFYNFTSFLLPKCFNKTSI